MLVFGAWVLDCRSGKSAAGRARWGLIRSAYLGLLALAVGLAGCSVVTIESNPPGAEIYYSETGLYPWMPWPPGADTPSVTPARVVGATPGIYVASVTRDGYYASQPQVIDCMRVGFARSRFDLTVRPQATPIEAPEAAPGMDVAMGGEPSDPTVQTPIDATTATLPADAARDASTDSIETSDITLGTTDPAERAKIVDLVDRFFELGAAPMTTPTLLANLGNDLPRVQVLNGTGETVSFLLSGPDVDFLSLPAYSNFSFQIAPGQYRVALREVDQASTTSIGTLSLRPGDWYYVAYRRAPDRPLPSPEATAELEMLMKTPELELPTYVEPPPVDGEKRGPSYRPGNGRGPGGYRPF
jgi:hypothetical protein